MKKLEQNLGVESLEFPDGGKTLKEQLKAKSDAIDNLPLAKKVENRGCSYGDKVGVYSGFWLEGGKDKYDNPGGGNGTFKFEGGSLNGTWNSKGAFIKGTLTSDGIKYNVTGSRFITQTGNERQTELSVLEGKGTVDLKGKSYSYNFEVGRDFKLSKVIYNGITINLEHERGSTYLKSSKGRLKLGSSVKEDVAAMWVALSISIVKNSGKELSYFETDDGNTLQADYEWKFWDTNLLTDCSGKLGVTATELVNWLNACRHSDFGI